MEHNQQLRDREQYFDTAKVINNFDHSIIVDNNGEHRGQKWDNGIPMYFRDHSWRSQKQEDELKSEERPLLRGEHEPPRPVIRQNSLK